MVVAVAVLAGFFGLLIYAQKEICKRTNVISSFEAWHTACEKD